MGTLIDVIVAYRLFRNTKKVGGGGTLSGICYYPIYW